MAQAGRWQPRLVRNSRREVTENLSKGVEITRYTTLQRPAWRRRVLEYYSSPARVTVSPKARASALTVAFLDRVSGLQLGKTTSTPLKTI